MAAKDFYSTLGVERNADADTLKKAYRKMAMKYHPDRNPGDAEAEKKFKELNDAYDTLKDPQKRAAYDRYGHEAYTQSGGGGGGGGGPRGFSSGDFSDIFGDFFSDMMGGGGQRGGGRPQASEGQDLRYNLTITLEDAFKGKKERIRFVTRAECGDCKGSGAKNGSQPKTCGQCRGTGRVSMRQAFIVFEQTCGRCGGSGSVIEDPCGGCGGQGRRQQEKELVVTVPEGVDSGSRIRLAGEGESGYRGGRAGDLYIFITVRDHDIFTRQGDDIHCRIPVKMTQAALGAELEVPVIDGCRSRLTVPQGAQSGDVIRLRGKGMPILRSGGRRGDMLVELQVETPLKLTKKQKELLEEFAAEEHKSTSPKTEQFFKKIKDLWEELRD